MEPSRKKLWVWRGFLWVGIMRDETSEHSRAFHKKVVRYYGFPTSHIARNINVMGSFFFFFEHSIPFCWVCFAGKVPASNIPYCTTYYYGFKRMKEEQGLLIQ
jgi:hypothetical protein